MSKQIRRLAVVLMAAYAVLFIQLNLTQLVRDDGYRANPTNTRDIVRSFSEPRGSIFTADGEVVAETIEIDGELERLRAYPHGELYSHLSGFLSLEYGADGLEQEFNDQLSGTDDDVRLQSISDLFVDRDRTGQLELTVRHDLQLVARAALGDRRGSVVALDPRTGAILAMWSRPAYDPNLLSTHDISAAREERARLLEDPTNPLLPRTYRERFAPGSTFKIVTAAAGLESGLVTQDAPVYPNVAEYLAPQTDRPLTNFGGSTCGGPLGELLRVSCNTGFAEMAVELGAERLVSQAEAFGFNSVPETDLPNPAESVIPAPEFFDDNIPLLAQSGIGQFEVAATPLQMALVAAAVANDGVMMRPYIVDRVVNADGELIDAYSPRIAGQPIGFTTAAQLQSMMMRVVDAGTAGSLRINNVLVGAKTGTAEIDGTEATHAWIIAFAPADDPQVAVAVLVEGDDALGQQTGGSVAGPIARAMIEAVLELPPSLDTAPDGGSSIQDSAAPPLVGQR